MTEADLAKKVIEWLQRHGWEVFQEVEYRGSVADIVCMQGPTLWVIECKKTLGLSVIGQAHHWIKYAHRVSVAIAYQHKKGKPEKQIRSTPARRFAYVVCKQFGIGILNVSASTQGREYGGRFDVPVQEKVAAPLRRKISAGLRDVLCEQHKTFAEAGSPTGRRWTPFTATCMEVGNYVRNYPGCSLKQMIDTISHHYATAASARASLKRWIDARKIPGVVTRYGNRAVTLHWDQKDFEIQRKARSRRRDTT